MDVPTLATGIAFIGTLVSILAGWLESKEPFNARKALGSVAAGLVYAVGVGLAVAYTSQELNWFVGGSVFLSAVGLNFYGKTIWSNTLGR